MHDLHVEIVAERATPLASTHTTGDATLHGLWSDTDNFGLYAFLLQGLRHLAQRQKSVTLTALTAID